MIVTKYIDLLEILTGVAPDALVEQMEKAGIVEQEVEIEIMCFTPARPGCMYLRNGDPGYPDEDAEWDEELKENYGCRVLSRLFATAATNQALAKELMAWRGTRENVVVDIYCTVNEAAEALDVELYEVEEAV